MASLGFGNKKRLRYLTPLLIGISVLIPAISYGGIDFGIFNALRKALVLLIFGVIYLFGYIGFGFFYIAAIGVDFIKDLNYGVLFSPLVKTGFDIVLNTANIGFVFALIFIAFATIFRSQTYGMKQMLWKLVVAAVMVNFSLLIAGVVIDFSNVLTQSFIGDGSVSTALIDKFQLQKVLVDPGAAAQKITEFFSDKTLGLFMTAGFAAIFVWIMAIILAAIAIMLVVRYVYLIVLVILMPLAWLFWTMPKYTHLNKKWWDHFFQQVLYLPAVFFFISLATKLTFTYLNPNDPAYSSALNSLQSKGVFRGTVETGINMFVLGGLLVGALIAGQSLGAAGSGLAMNFAKGARRKITRGFMRGGGYATRGAREAAGRGTRRVTGTLGTGLTKFYKNVADTARKFTPKSKVGKGAARIGRIGAAVATLGLSEAAIAGVKGVGRGVGDIGAKAVSFGEQRKNIVENSAQKLIKNNPTAKARAARYRTASSRKEISASFLAAKKTGEMDAFLKNFEDEGQKNKLVGAVISYGLQGEFKKAAPEMAPLVATKEERKKAREEIAKTPRGVTEKEVLRYKPGTFEEKDLTEKTWEENGETRHRIPTTGKDGKKDGGMIVKKEVEKEITKEDIDKYLKRKAAPDGGNRDAAHNWTVKTVSDESVASGIDLGQLKAIGRGGSDEKIAALGATLERLGIVLDKFNSDTASPAEREQMMALSMAQRNRLGQLVEFARSNPTFVGVMDYSGRSEPAGKEKGQGNKDEDKGK